MLFAVARCRAWSARAAIVLAAGPAICPGPAYGQDAAAPVLPGGLDPNSPLAAMPGLGVDWPDLAKPDAPIAAMPLDPGVPAPAPAPKTKRSALDLGTGEQRYTIRIDGIAGVREAALRGRFDALSALRQDEGKPANVAQIDRRARQDADLLRDLLRAQGYYDAEVDTAVAAPSGPGAPKLAVTLTAMPGTVYDFASVTLPGLERSGDDLAGLVRAFGIRAGDPVDAEAVDTGIASLKAALGTRGYAFALVADPAVTVDHDAHRATLLLGVDPGRVMRIGAIRISGAKKVFGPRHVALISRLHPGDRYDARRLDDLRRALIATGLVSVAQVTPQRTADPQIVDLAVRLEPAPPRTIAGSIGYGTGEGASVEVDWTHRNLFPPEGGLTLRGKLGTQEQLASVQFRRGNFRARDQVLTAQIAADHQNRPAYDAKTLTLATGIERQTNIIWQKKWTYSYGLEAIASDEQDVIAATGVPRRRTYLIAALPLSLSYDGSDDLLNPSKGYRLSAHVSPEYSLRSPGFAYARIQLDASAYQPFGARVVFAERVRLGSIQGGTRDDIAPTRRFYSGGGGSVRGFGYQKIGPRDVDNDPIGGKSLAEFGLEARIRFGNFGVVPFLDGGNLYTQSLPRFTGLRYGTGMGVRYYTSFGPIRLDVGTPINPLPGDSRVAVYVSLGQAF